MGGLVALVAASAVTPSQAIWNGERVSIRDLGFMVSVRPPEHPRFHLCGGTLITPEIVLTAAHCLAGLDATKLTVIVGADMPEWKRARQVPVTGFRVPPRFSMRASNRNDLALLRLARPQSSPTIGLAPAEPAVRTELVTAGWGCTDRPPRCNRHPFHLQSAHQRVVPDSRCGRSTFWNPPAHAPTSICARGANQGANRGDSGGPLLVGDDQTGFTQVGVVSLASDKWLPLNAYTSVPALRSWIDRAVAALARG